MAEKRYYWMKFQKDFFSTKEIKKLRRIAGGDTYTVIYLKMLLLSIDTDGILYYEGIEDTFASELALTLDETTENVGITISFLLSHSLMKEIDNGDYLLVEAQANIGSEAASTVRSRKSRERKKNLALQEGIDAERNRQEQANKLSTALQCNKDATNCNGDVTVDNQMVKKSGNTRDSLQFDGRALQYNETELQCNKTLQCNNFATQEKEKERDKEIITPSSITKSIQSKPVDNFSLPTSVWENDFNSFWQFFPSHEGDITVAQKMWNMLRNRHVDGTDLVEAARRYATKVLREQIPAKFVKKPANFLRDNYWLQFVPQGLRTCPVCHGEGIMTRKSPDGYERVEYCVCTERYKCFDEFNV